MDDEVRLVLQEIGTQLDRNCFPTIHNGGVVVPSSVSVTATHLGTEMADATLRQIGPSTGSRQGTASWEGTTRRSRPPRRSTSAARRRFQAYYEGQLTEVWTAYPQTKVWNQDEGMWLLTDSAVLNGLRKTATFLVWLPFEPGGRVKSWGFWTASIGVCWIGPRHTNWPDGDICAYTPADGTWRPGGNLVQLLDLNTLWALRHLYLQEFDRWPGYHSAPHPYERITELRDDEFCGCENGHLLYENCCKAADLAQDRPRIAIDFSRRYMRNGLRSPPRDIVQFALRRSGPPRIRSFAGLQ